MYKYLFFIICGIILYILWNKYDGFSIGIPTYSIQSIDPIITFSPAPESELTFTGDNKESAVNGNDLTLIQYITGQDESAFPGGTANYVLVSNDEEGVPPEPCPVEEGEPPPIDCYREQLIKLDIQSRLIDYIITEYQNLVIYKRLKSSCASHSRLGEKSPLSILSTDLLQSILSDQLLTLDVSIDQNTNKVYGGIFYLPELIRILNYLNENEILIHKRMVDDLIKLLRLGLTADEIITGIIHLGIIDPLMDNNDSKIFIINIYLIIKNKSFYDIHITDRDALEDKFYQMVNGDPG